MNTWIKTSTELPEATLDLEGYSESDEVLIRTWEGEVYLASLRRTYDGESVRHSWEIAGLQGRHVTTHITHWLPIPELR